MNFSMKQKTLGLVLVKKLGIVMFMPRDELHL